MSTTAVSPLRDVWRDMSNRPRELSAAAIVGALASLSAVALLGTSAYLIAKAAEMPPVLTLTVAAVMVRAFAIGRAVFRYGERLIGHDAAFRGLTELRVRVYESLERITPIGLMRFTRGDLLARLGADVDAAMDLPLRVVLPWTQAGLVALASIAFLFWVLPQGALVIGLFALLLVTLIPWLIAITTRKAEARIAPARGIVVERAVHAIDAASELVVLGATNSVVRSVASADDSLIAVTKREAYAVGLGTGASTVLQGAAVVAALITGIPAVVSGEIEPVWLAVLALLPLALFEVLATVPSAAISLQRLRGSVDRIAEIDSTASTQTAQPTKTSDVRAGTPFTGYEISNLSARWPSASADTLHDISFTVSPGERIALVGPSGSGKSTLVAALMGFLPYEGSALLNGIEIGEQGSDDVCAQVGLLTQQAHIFDTTVGANVHIGSPHREVNDDAIQGALRQAQLLSWVESLPAGLDTEVGTFGARMSGGERQRLALARLLVSERGVFILDEPTEHLDAQTSREVDRTIHQATRHRTTITVSHNITAISDCDVIHVMDAGCIISSGNHATLIQECEWYRTQWHREQESLDMERIIAGGSHG